ncbi:MAG: MATE family efflux transporter [Prolixibacteraceae bacterium]|nr:MATE family efflux transporter [Prolixibacteraceae bacterium]
MTNTGIFKAYLPFYQRLLKLAFPLVLTQAGQTIVQLVDNAMVGRVGTTELAAAAFANSVFVIVMVFGIGIFLGITPLIGHASGANDDHKVAGMIKNGLILSMIMIVLLTAITYAISYLMPFMKQPTEVWQMAIPYYKMLTWSLIPFLLFMFLKQVGEGLNNTSLAMIATITSNVINVVLNYLLIFGKMGFPELGLNGAGIATLISRISMPVFIYVGFRYKKNIFHFFRQVPSERFNMKVMKQLLAIGFPIAAQMLVEVSTFAFGAIMMGWMGDVALASHQVAMGLAGFTFMIANGVAMAATIRTSFQLGKKDFMSMEKVAFSAIHLVLGYMIFCALLFFIFRFQLPKMFSPDTAVIAQAASLLIIAGIFQVFDGLQIVGLGILRGFADVKAPMFIATISYLIIGIPVSYLLAFTFKIGPEGIWIGFATGLASAALMLFIRIKMKIKEVEAKG